MSQFDIDLGGGNFSWGDLSVENLTKSARERAQRAIDEATLTVNLPPFELPTSVTLGSGGVEPPPAENGTNGNGTGTGNRTTLLLVGVAVALFVLMRK